MTFLALLLALHFGLVTPYAPGVAERVAERRVSWGQITQPAPGLCLAALNDDRIGEYVLVLHGRGATWCYVVDCAAPSDAIERKTHSLILEVDAQTYRRIGGGRVAVWE